MLGKLMKYEVKATARTYLPLFALLAFFTVTNRISLSLSLNNAQSESFNLIQGVLMFAYVMTILLIAAAAILITIQRFHRNLLGDEGYLMFTLPSGKGKLITSKLLVATGWNFLAVILCLLSIFFVAAPAINLPSVWEAVNRFLSMFALEMGYSFWHVIFVLILLALVATVMSILLMYASMAVGHLANKHRVIKSIGAFMGLSIVLETIGIWVLDAFYDSRLFDGIFHRWNGPSLGEVWLAFGGIIVLLALFSVGLYFGTKLILDRRLNLE